MICHSTFFWETDTVIIYIYIYVCQSVLWSKCDRYYVSLRWLFVKKLWLFSCVSIFVWETAIVIICHNVLWESVIVVICQYVRLGFCDRCHMSVRSFEKLWLLSYVSTFVWESVIVDICQYVRLRICDRWHMSVRSFENLWSLLRIFMFLIYSIYIEIKSPIKELKYHMNFSAFIDKNNSAFLNQFIYIRSRRDCHIWIRVEWIFAVLGHCNVGGSHMG